MGTMQPERLVRLQGLTARPDLNGRIGHLERLANGEDGAPRWAVQLRGDDGHALVADQPILLKEQNLKPVSNLARLLSSYFSDAAIFEATTEAPAPDAEAVAAWVGPAPERVWAT